MIHIHVAEDDNLSFFLIEKILIQAGFSVTRSLNGQDVIEFAREAAEDSIILMDVNMPVMDGYQALLEIRKFNSTIPVIIQSAACMPEEIELAFECGCTDYIMKPFGKGKLMEVILKHSFDVLQQT